MGPQTGGRERILLAGHLPHRFEDLRSALDARGFAVIGAESVTECTERLSIDTAVAVVGDALPDRDLWPLVESLSDGPPDLPVIVHPTTATEQTATCAYDAGATLFVSPAPGAVAVVANACERETSTDPAASGAGGDAVAESRDVAVGSGGVGGSGTAVSHTPPLDPDGIRDSRDKPGCLIDADGVLVAVNDALVALHGTESAAEVVGRPVLQFLHPADHDAAQAAWTRVLEGVTVDSETLRLLVDEGDTVPVRVIMSPDMLDGEWVGRATVEDRRPYHELLAGFRARHDITQQSLDALQDTYAILSPDGDVLHWNDRVNEVTGYSDDEIASMNAADFLTDERRDDAETFLEAALTAGTANLSTELETRDGGVRLFEFNIARLEHPDGHLHGLVSIGRDITDRERLAREVAENEKRYRRLVELSPYPIVVHVNDGIVYANDALADLVAADSVDALLGADIMDFVVEAEHAEARDRVQSVLREEEPAGWTTRTLQALDGTVRHIEVNGRAISFGGHDAILAVFQDVTERTRYEHKLTVLHTRTRKMMAADTISDVAAVAVEAATTLLDVDAAGVYYFVEPDGALEPACLSDVAQATVPDDLTSVVDSGILWGVFTDGAAANWTADDADHCHLTGAFPLGRAIPLGNHGVFAICKTTDRPLDSVQLEFARLLAWTLEAALDRVARMQDLQVRDDRLATQNETLSRVNRLNEIVRRTTQTVVRATTHTEILENVCAELASHEHYEFVWYADASGSAESIRPRTWAGIDAEYVDLLPSVADQMRALFDEAVDSRRTAIHENILTDPDWSGHRRDALTYGFRSLAAVPVVRNGRVDGVFVVHASRTNLFDDEERSVLTELGRTVGYAAQAVERSVSVDANERTELALAIVDEWFLPNRLAAATESEVQYVGGVSDDGDTVRLFVRFTDASTDDVTDAVADWKTVHEARPVAVNDDCLFQVTVGRPDFLDVCRDADAHILEMTAVDGTTTVRVTMPTTVDVRAFVDSVESHHEGTDLLARRDRTTSIDTRETFSERLRNALTDRQLEALQTAAYGGFYEWPRETSTEDLGALLDIASSTFQYHLRAAERKLVAEILAAEDSRD